MNRRKFLKNAGLTAGWVGVAVAFAGCSEDDGPAAPASGGAGDVNGVIASNHGHVVWITDAQIDAGGAVTLTLTGGAHSHTVNLTNQQVSTIGMGDQVSTTSTSDSGHTHGVVFN